MPLLNETKDNEALKLQEDWFAVRRFVKKTFEKRPDINAILFLIGMNEFGLLKEVWEKEEKQDLMHISICKLFEDDGYWQFTGRDDQGWPHYIPMKKMPKIELKEQDGLLKTQIIKYFRKNNYI